MRNMSFLINNYCYRLFWLVGNIHRVMMCDKTSQLRIPSSKEDCFETLIGA